MSWQVDPYATWDPTLATDESDGLPDRAIVPLIETLRKRGVVTLQSCAGHLGSDDGVLWIAAGSVEEASIPKAFPISHVRRTYVPEDRWEIGWEAKDADYAISVLGDALRAVPECIVSLTVPLRWQRDAVLTVPFPMTAGDWEQMQSVIRAMQPGLVREPAAIRQEGGSE